MNSINKRLSKLQSQLPPEHRMSNSPHRAKTKKKIAIYSELRRKQNNSCAICKEEFNEMRRSYLDHDHGNDRIRALLCAGCNIGLGQFHDDKKLLELAWSYLHEHQGKEPQTNEERYSYYFKRDWIDKT